MAAFFASAISRFFAIALAFSLTLATTAESAEDDDSSATGVIARLIEAARNPTPFDHLRTVRLVRNSFDLEAIAKTILGKYWAKANARQRRDFMDALLNAMRAGVLDQLKKRRQVTVTFGTTRKTMNGDTLVGTKITTPNGRVRKVDWRLHTCSYGFCIVDVIVDGGSLAIQRRDEAAALLSANGGSIDVLSRRLRANPAHPFN